MRPRLRRGLTIERGTKAPQAAGGYSYGFEKKFIKADIVSFGEFNGWKKAREIGKRSEGKEYVMRMETSLSLKSVHDIIRTYATVRIDACFCSYR